MEELQKRQRDMYETYSHQSQNAEKILFNLEKARVDAEQIAREEVRTPMFHITNIQYLLK